MSIANTSAACSTACLSDTKTRLYSCSRWRNLLISEEAAIIVFFGQEKNCSAAHRAKNSIMSCNMLAAHIIVLLAALLVWVMLMKRRQGFLLGCGAAECCLNDDTTQNILPKRAIVLLVSCPMTKRHWAAHITVMCMVLRSRSYMSCVLGIEKIKLLL